MLSVKHWVIHTDLNTKQQAQTVRDIAPLFQFYDPLSPYFHLLYLVDVVYEAHRYLLAQVSITPHPQKLFISNNMSSADKFRLFWFLICERNAQLILSKKISGSNIFHAFSQDFWSEFQADGNPWLPGCESIQGKIPLIPYVAYFLGNNCIQNNLLMKMT